MGFGTGLSGLQASSSNLDVIGHNIANANTVGMKAGRAEFAEVYASSLGASGGSNGGIGVTVSRVAQMFNQGNIRVTSNTLDLAINGPGFFKVLQTDGSAAYTRNGEFKLDKEGFIVTNSSARLQGYPTDPTGKRTTVVTEDMRLPTGSLIQPRATGTDPDPDRQGLFITANLNAGTQSQSVGGAPAVPLGSDHRANGTAVNVYDEAGNPIPLEVFFIKSDNPGEWYVRGSLDGGAATLFDMGTVTFDSAGQPTSNASLSAITIAADAVSPGVPTAAITVPPLNIGDGTAAKPYTLTQFASKFSVYDLKQDGYAAGELTSINIAENGTVTARYSNGTSQAAGQVGLTMFRNVQGLQPINGGYWEATFDSGEPIPGAPQEARMGSLRSGALEESNVDLTGELVNMIVAQRSYQANAQTIKTQDQVLSTLVNLR